MQKKILMIGPSKEVPGGITEVVSTFFSGNIPNTLHIEYLQVCRSGKTNKFRKLIEVILSLLKYIKINIKESPDIIHIHSSSNASFYRKSLFVLIAKVFKRKVIFHIHSGAFIEFYKDLNFLLKRFTKFVLNSTNLVLTVADYWKDGINKEIDIRTPIRVVHNPVNITEYNGVLTKKGLSNELRKRVLYLGKISKNKGVFDILEVVPKILKDNPNVIFTFAGNGDGDSLKHFWERVSELNINSNIEFLGWLDTLEKVQVLSNSDMLLLPSYKEAFGKVLIEAMAAGIPVVASNVGGIPDIIKNFENGILINAGDQTQLTDGIKFLLNNKKEYVEMSEQNIIDVQKFDVNKIIKKLEDIYNGVIKEAI
jgi:glycosyltransferase involved in cell wall biosynthesis